MKRALAVRVLLGEAVRAVVRHKARSGLTALGITIGIAAVVWVVAIGRAGSARAEDQLRELGDNLVWVEAGSRNIAGLRTGAHGTNSLTMEDDLAIGSDVPLIKSVSPNVDGSVLLVHGDRNWTSRYRGVSPEYMEIKRWEISEGASFTDDAVRHATNVCLIGETVRERLFGAETAVGEIVRIGVEPFEVVGVLGHKGQSGNGQDQDDTVMMPYTTVQKKLRGKGISWLDDIMCSAVSPQAVEPAVSQITELLRQRHHIGPERRRRLQHPAPRGGHQGAARDEPDVRAPPRLHRLGGVARRGRRRDERDARVRRRADAGDRRATLGRRDRARGADTVPD